MSSLHPADAGESDAYETPLLAGDFQADAAAAEPEGEASGTWLLPFAWVWPQIVRPAYWRGFIHHEHVPRLVPGDEPDVVDMVFDRAWSERKGESTGSGWTLARTLLFAHRWRIVGSGILLLLSQVFFLLTPFVFELLLNQLQETDSERHWTDHLLLAFALYGCQVLQSLFIHVFWYIAQRGGVRCQTALMTFAHAKLARLSPSARSRYTEAELSTRLTIDCSRIADTYLGPFLHWGTWSPVLIIVVAVAMLYRLLGWPALLGFALLVLLAPLSAWTTRRVKAATAHLQVDRDARGKVVGEALNSLRGIRALGWSEAFLTRLLARRESEEGAIWTSYMLYMVNRLVAYAGQGFLAMVSIVLYALVRGNRLTPAVIFPALSWFSAMQQPLMMLPNTLKTVVEVSVSLERLERFFNEPESVSRVDQTRRVERDVRSTKRPVTASESAEESRVVLRNVSFAYSKESSEFSLAVPQLEIRRGMNIILGSVASGKSSLLLGIAGEMEMQPIHANEPWQCVVRGSIAVVQQDPWLLQRSILENITLGSPWDPDWFDQVMEACDLANDVASLPAGVHSLVGERGTLLSGGQRQRLGLARALYADADVYLLDDVMSALDKRTSRTVWESLFRLLVDRGKSVLLCTHHTELAADARVERAMELCDGQLRDVSHGATDDGAAVKATEKEEHERTTAEGSAESASWQRPLATKGEAMSEEDSHIGTVQWKHVRAYIGSCAPLGLLIVMAVLFVTSVALEGFVPTLWLKHWIGHAEETSANRRYAYVYIALSVSDLVMFALRMTAILWGSIRAAGILHDHLAMSLLHAPFRILDHIPTGRMFNRLLKDQSTVDTSLQTSVAASGRIILRLVGIGIVMVASTPWALIVLVVLVVPYSWIGLHFRLAARDLRRLESTARSPLLSHFSDVIRGLPTIRCMGLVGFFREELMVRIQSATKAYMAMAALNQWVTVWLEQLGCLILLAAVLFAVIDTKLSADTVGFLLSFVMQTPLLLLWLVRNLATAEMDLVAVERMREYSEFPHEDEEILDNPRVGSLVEATNIAVSDPLPLTWQGVTLRYRPEDSTAPPALASLDLAVPAGAKVGILGRTGSGKSSILNTTLGFYRFDGSVFVGELGVRTAPSLSTVRSRVTTILQEGMLFDGTVRENLLGFPEMPSSERLCRAWRLYGRGVASPLALHSINRFLEETGEEQDVRCRRALERVGLGNVDSLAARVQSGGENWSAGERQLLCLARALLHATGVVFLDEMTSKVDRAADATIHDILFDLPATVVCIMHRLDHIRRFDHVIVLAQGRVVEQGPPEELLTHRQSQLFIRALQEREARAERDE